VQEVIQIGNVTQKGQVTIPASLRKEYGITPKSRIVFITLNNRITLKPLRKDITAFFGMAKKLGIKTLHPKEAEKQMRLAIAREIAKEGQ